MSIGRIHVVDALRGFAIVSIMLLHHVEHFDYYYTPENVPQWLAGIDQFIWSSLFFLFGGKSYAIFALLFGLTFFIQKRNQEERGKSFDLRYAWRLLLLFGFGMVNSAFFQGDILTLYAAVGILLIPLTKLKDKALLAVAILLLLQPLQIYHIIDGAMNPELILADPVSWTYFGKMGAYIEGGSILDTLWGNLSNGKIAVLHWNWENGRFFHMLALFIFGVFAGRKGIFTWNSKNKALWKKILIGASLIFVPLYILGLNTNNLFEAQSVQRPFYTLISSWANLSFMLVLVSGFVLLFHSKVFHKPLHKLSPMGSMSLSNYVLQSLSGSFIYYGFGLGLYEYTSPSMSLLIGIVLAVVVGYLCWWWSKHYKRGPLESIWHKLTWIGTNK